MDMETASIVKHSLTLTIVQLIGDTLYSFKFFCSVCSFFDSFGILAYRPYSGRVFDPLSPL